MNITSISIPGASAHAGLSTPGLSEAVSSSFAPTMSSFIYLVIGFTAASAIAVAASLAKDAIDEIASQIDFSAEFF